MYPVCALSNIKAFKAAVFVCEHVTIKEG